MPVELESAQVKTLVAGIRIPAKPEFLDEAIQILQSPNPDLGEAARVIGSDVGLAGALLKTVNSPFFGLRARVISVRHAAVLLGLRNVTNLLMSLALRDSMRQVGIRLDRFWDTAYYTARANAAIARELGLGRPDEAYVLGLFHDCGIPLLLQRFAHYGEVLRRGNCTMNRSPAELESEELGTNHAIVGAWVARAWRMPELVVTAIQNHHDLTTLREHVELAPQVAMLALASHIAHINRRGQEDFEWERVASTVCATLGLGERECAEIVKDVDDLLD